MFKRCKIDIKKLVIEFIFTVTPSKVVITRVQTKSLSNKSAKWN